MAHLDRYTVTITSLTTGTDVFYTPAISGYLHSVNYRPTATTPWVATADFKLSSTDQTIVALTTATQLTTGGWTYYPRAPKATSAAATTAISERIAVVDQRLRMSVSASTLAGMTGSFDIFVDGNFYPST